MFGPQQKTYELFRGGAAMRPGSRSGAWIARRKGASELHITRVIQLALSENRASSQMATLMGKMMGNHHVTQLDNVNYRISVLCVSLHLLR